MGNRTKLFGVLFMVVIALGLWFEQSSLKKRAVRSMKEAFRSWTRPERAAPEPEEVAATEAVEETVAVPEPVVAEDAVDVSTQVMVRNAMIDYVLERSKGTGVFPYTGPYTGYEPPGTEFQTMALMVDGIREEVTIADDPGSGSIRKYASCLFLRGAAHRWDLDLIADVVDGRVVSINEKFHEVGPANLSPIVGFVPISR